MFKRCLISILSVFILCGAAKAINIKDITGEELSKLYEKHEYYSHFYISDWKFPPIFLEKFPSDYTQIQSKDDRNKMFIMIMGPLTLKLNQEILNERRDVRILSRIFNMTKELSPSEIKELEAFAVKYDVFTRLKGTRRYDFLIKELMKRVNIIPPSLLIASAAINTDWGTSYPAQKANNFYKILEWAEDKGLPPETPGEEKFNSKIYPSIYASMQDYALKLNSQNAFEMFRHTREAIEYRGKPVLGREVAFTMIIDNNLQNFAGLLDYTITFYQLINFDTATLQ